MNESNKELGPLHCVYFIYYSFATTTDKDINDVVSYYMGKNTQSRQNFIIDNLKNEDLGIKND